MSGSLGNVKFTSEGVEKRKPMSRYSPEFCESIVKKMMPPNLQSIALDLDFLKELVMKNDLPGATPRMQDA
jgi:hypothetical protein